MHARTTTSRRATRRTATERTALRGDRRPPHLLRRPGLSLGVATAGAIAVHVVLFGGDPAAQADAAPAPEPVSVAAQLGLTAGSTALDPAEDLEPLEELAANRSERDAARTAASKAQAAADRAEVERRKAEAREKARAEAAAKAKAAAEKAAAEERAAAAAAEEAAAEERAAQAPAEQAAAAPGPAAPARQAPASTAGSAVARISNSAGAVAGVVQAAANAVVSNVPCSAGLTLGGTRPSASDPGGHPSGRALDYMVMSNTACGDAIVQYHIANWDALGVDYIIWRQRYLSSPGGGWSAMGDRGSPTANHMDHPHVNYRG